VTTLVTMVVCISDACKNTVVITCILEKISVW